MKLARRQPRRRTDGAITTPLECFRNGKDGVAMRNALAQLAVRLVDAEDREELRKADGVTSLGTFTCLTIQKPS
ncbi:hypothetical protein BBJ28_00004279 [Nothophytophthora sp. Chile5]|nr:hypothetical protein BBJ28_00004279 [Nothophytophthora sp. Chile5]